MHPFLASNVLIADRLSLCSTQCAISTYKTTAGAATCTACPANSETLSTGASALTACVASIGYTGPNVRSLSSSSLCVGVLLTSVMLPSQGGAFTICAIGTWKGTTGSAACTGKFRGCYAAFCPRGWERVSLIVVAGVVCAMQPARRAPRALPAAPPSATAPAYVPSFSALFFSVLRLISRVSWLRVG